jgi:hypothetical protein
MECGSEASAHAEANASALQTGQRAAPLSHLVGEGLGVRAESGRTLHTVNPSDVPLSVPPRVGAWRTNGCGDAQQAGHGVPCPYNATPFTSNGEPLGGWAMQRASA